MGFFDAIDYDERITYLVTLLLTVFAFLAYAHEVMPDIPVSTWMDNVIFFSTLNCLLAMVESLVLWLVFRYAMDQDLSFEHEDMVERGYNGFTWALEWCVIGAM